MAALPLLYVRAFAGDAQVHLVFAENAAHGQFFTFNPGERVAGETSPGYMLLGAFLFRVLPAPAVPAALKVVGLAAWYALVWLVFLVAARSLGDRRWALVAAVAAGLMPGSAYNANVGMENGVFAALVWLWFLLAGRWSWLTQARLAPRREAWLGALLVAACWLRPEGFVVLLVAWATRAARVRPRPALWSIVFGATLALSLAALAFQLVETGTLAATSIRSRRLMAEHESIARGPIFFDPALARRLLAYLPLTALYVISQPARRERSAVDKLGLALLLVFCVLFSFGTGAAHLARYMIFLFPVLAIGAARGAARLWNRDLDWFGRRSRLVTLAAAAVLAGVYALEARTRLQRFPDQQLAIAMTSVGQRAARTDELLAALGHPTKRPLVLAYESVELRYELDDRVVIRSLDGRVDPELLRCTARGLVDHICYLGRRNVDFLMQAPAYDRVQDWTLAKLRRLRPGEAVEHGGLRFTSVGKLGALRVTAAPPPAASGT